MLVLAQCGSSRRACTLKASHRFGPFIAFDVMGLWDFRPKIDSQFAVWCHGLSRVETVLLVRLVGLQSLSPRLRRRSTTLRSMLRLVP